MMRVITSPAVLPPDALAELKDWLGITTTQSDTTLTNLLQVAVDVCSDFTGLTPLLCGCEEMLPLPAFGQPLPPPLDWQQRNYPADWRMPQAYPGFHELTTRPVQGVTGVQGVDISGNRATFAPSTYEVMIDAEGTCRIRVDNPSGFQRCAVQFTAGLAASWAQLPNPIRQGIIYLAAYQQQTSTNLGAVPAPPASVTALWLPWRRVRLV